MSAALQNVHKLWQFFY